MSGAHRPTDDDGYSVRIHSEPPDRDLFTEWAKASALSGEVWELVDANGEVVERYEADQGVSR